MYAIRSYYAPVALTLLDHLVEGDGLLDLGDDGLGDPDLRSALEHLLSAGGKRIRPTLGLLVGNMLGAPEEKLITLGASVELLHTATLVHDDLIDGALLRRGMPTLNARWSPAATVLTGDFLFARAAKLAAETDYLPLMKLFADRITSYNVCYTKLLRNRTEENRSGGIPNLHRL